MWVEEAEFSARTVKSLMPDMSITLVTDADTDTPVFDLIIQTEHYDDPWLYKIDMLAQSPYEETLFLDTDTYACKPFEEIFDLLRRYDVAASIIPLDGQTHPDLPDYFYAYNTGVILFRQTPQTEQLFADWYDLYLRYVEQEKRLDYPILTASDQPSFNKAILEADATIFTLPNIYNCRGLNINMVWSPVKILHLRPTYRDEFVALERLLNHVPHWPKVFLGWDVYIRNRKDGYMRVGNNLLAMNGMIDRHMLSLIRTVHHFTLGLWRLLRRKVLRRFGIARRFISISLTRMPSDDHHTPSNPNPDNVSGLKR